MGLTIKKFQGILNNMVSWISVNTRKLTDFSEGSAIRTILEAVSFSIEQTYFSMYKNVMWAIENSIYEAFNFSKIPAIPSNGVVTITFSYPILTPIFIPVGTRFAAFSQESNLIYFETREEYVISANSITADVEIFCTSPGIIGNVASNSINILVNPISGVSNVTNSEGFLTGSEEETTSNRKQRFNRYIETLARGTKKAIEYGAKEVEGVAGVWVDDSQIGLVKVYVHDLNGNLSDSLKSRVETNLENYRSAGIPCQVFPISKTEISLELVVTVLPFYNNNEFRNNLTTSVSSYINNFPVSKSFYISDLIQFVMNYNDTGITNVSVVSPIADIIIPQQEIIRSNDIDIVLTLN